MNLKLYAFILHILFISKRHRNEVKKLKGGRKERKEWGSGGEESRGCCAGKREGKEGDKGGKKRRQTHWEITVCA